jgi:hypothetical protein
MLRQLGVLDFYEGRFDKLLPNEKPGRLEFSYELPDHLPLWIQVDTDAEKIDQILLAKKPEQSTRAMARSCGRRAVDYAADDPDLSLFASRC